MDEAEIKKDYDSLGIYFLDFQKEIFLFVEDFKKRHEHVIDFIGISQRPGKQIKSIGAVMEKIVNKNDRYKKLTDLNDIAGVRLTCHCEDDAEQASVALEGELKQNYSNVVLDSKTDKYKAIHLNFSKEIQVNGRVINIYAEIQVRTVMQDAWAIQDTKYNYRKTDGEPQELAGAVSEIMYGCEKLWLLVKNKSIEKTGGNIELKQDINKAQRILGEVALSKEIEKWFKENQDTATKQAQKLGIIGQLEIQVRVGGKKEFTLKDLKDSAGKSTIQTFGWPIGVFMHKEEFSPKPTTDGIKAEIAIDGPDWFTGGNRKSYDYWSINKNGCLYMLMSLFEDEREPESIFFNTRIVRLTEFFMYLNNLYTSLGIAENETIQVKIKHSGIKGRNLSAAGSSRRISPGYKINEDYFEKELTIKLSDLQTEEGYSKIVASYLMPFFQLFNFFELSDDVLKDISSQFLKGKVT